MKVNAAVVAHEGDDWDVREINLEQERLKPGEVLIEMGAAGLCHTDEHIRMGELPARFPFVGGHEGAGRIVKTGPDVQDLEMGDHVVLTFRPSCGVCEYCVDGMPFMCHLIKDVQAGDPDPRFSDEGQPLNAQSLIGTFSEYAIARSTSCVKIDRDVPFDVAALLGCAVPTGYGAAVHAAQVHPGDRVIVVGMGGVGANAIQGANVAGASAIVAVDIADEKLKTAAQFGATHTCHSLEEADTFLQEQGGAPTAIILTVGLGTLIQQAVGLLRGGGTLVLAALGDPEKFRIDLPVNQVAMNNIRIQGTVMGSSSLRRDIPRILELYKQGKYDLDALITQRVPLGDIREGYENLTNGAGIRTVIDYGI